MAQRTQDPPAGLDSLVVELRTEEGHRLIVGGICAHGRRDDWLERFQLLRQLKLYAGHDCYDIDYILARSIETLSDRSLLLAGASLRVEGAGVCPGAATGGVLGCPQEDIESALGQTELLPNGFAIDTYPGGPGLAALASPEVLAQALERLRTPQKNRREQLENTLSAYGITTGIMVFDGTGREDGCVAAFSPGRLELLDFAGDDS